MYASAWEIRKTAAVLAWTGVLLAAGALLAARVSDLGAAAGDAIAHSPYLLAASGALLSLWFNRVRMAFCLGLLALAHGVLASFPPGPPGLGADGQVVYAALCLLLPLNLVYFTLAAERPLFTLGGMARLAVIPIQVAAVVVASGAGGDMQRQAAALLHYRPFDPAFDMWTYLPQPAMLAFPLAAAVLLARAATRRGPLECGALGALAASALALHAIGDPAAPAVYFAAGTLALSVGVIRDIRAMAYDDELTGLPGRRALAEAMRALGGRYAIAMVDVDHFKKFNDTYGHAVGDHVLKMVAGHLRGVGGGGKAFRYGGEEFSVLFPAKRAEEASLHLEDLRRAVAGAAFALRAKDRPKVERRKTKRPGPAPKKVGVTISLGVAERKDGSSTPEEVLKAADEALYRAKDKGRNRLSR